MCAKKVNQAETRLFARRKRLQHLGEHAPKFSMGIELGTSGGSDYYLSLPFKRSLLAIILSGAFFAVFTIPLFSVGSVAFGEADDSLFSLIAVLFSLFWMLGWSVGVGILGLIFLAVTFGRETLRIRNNQLILRIGLPGIGIGFKFHGDVVRYFRKNKPDVIAGTTWRGEHLCFDYVGESINFGSAISAEKAEEILSVLKQAFPKYADTPMKFSARKLSDEEPVSETEPIVGIESVASSEFEHAHWSSISSLSLIAANLVPLLGVALLDWRIGEIMLLFWAESAVIGFYTLCKMWRIGKWSVLFYGPFFVGHYGGFMAGHLLFIYALFGSEFTADGDLPEISQVFVDFLAMAPALIAFLLSHGISFFTNFIRRKEYLGKSIAVQMQEPYKRIIIMHLTIIFRGFLVMALETPLPALVLLIVMKMLADLKAHLKEHA